MDGIEVVGFGAGSEPSRFLPADLNGCRVALKMGGGVGDALIAISSVAKVLSESGAIVTAVALPHQHELLLTTKGVSGCESIQSFNEFGVRSKFDVVIDFAGVFNNAKEFRQGCYYDLVSQRLATASQQHYAIWPGEFQFTRSPTKVSDRQVVAIHPTASNPNRRWDNAKWEELAYELRDQGMVVAWLGTRDEFGFSDKFIIKMSDSSSNLLIQARDLARCHYFIGCDSGFAHIAGLLEVPGLVLFGNTEPEDVIGKYPSLSPVDAFNRLCVRPSRSLSADCPQSRTLMDAITVEDVITAAGLSEVEVTSEVRHRKDSAKMPMAVVGVQDPGLVQWLQENYDVRVFGSMPLNSAKFEAVLEQGPQAFRVITHHREASVDPNNRENLARAIRELVEAGEK